MPAQPARWEEMVARADYLLKGEFLFSSFPRDMVAPVAESVLILAAALSAAERDNEQLREALGDVLPLVRWEGINAKAREAYECALDALAVSAPPEGEA